jgi:hypothetical protein
MSKESLLSFCWRCYLLALIILFLCPAVAFSQAGARTVDFSARQEGQEGVSSLMERVLRAEGWGVRSANRAFIATRTERSHTAMIRVLYTDSSYTIEHRRSSDDRTYNNWIASLEGALNRELGIAVPGRSDQWWAGVTNIVPIPARTPIPEFPAPPERNWSDDDMKIVAVMPIQSDEYANHITGRIEAEVNDLGYFSVVTQTQLRSILESIDLGASDLFDPANAVRVGDLLAANTIVVGHVTRIGREHTLQLQLLDVATSRVLHSAEESAPRMDRVGIEMMTRNAVYRLAHSYYENQAGRVQIE